MEDKFFNHSLKRFFIGGEGFKKEVKQQIRLLIIVTLGFTIAFSWRQTIFDSTERLIDFLFHFESSVSSSIITSLAITVISLVLIWIASKILAERE